MLRIHGDRDSLLAALAAHWVDQQLQIPIMPKPLVRPICCLNGSGINRGRASAPAHQLQAQGCDGFLLGSLHGHGADAQLEPSGAQR